METSQPETILLVDDNPANLQLLSQILRDRGYNLRAVTSGARALASAAMSPPDLVLLDVRMPGMDGYEVCRRLKETPATRDTPVLFISALDEIEDKVRAFAAGGLDYITKPFQLEEVIARVETHLALRRLQRDLQEANRRMERELALAAQVQASFLPQSLPAFPGWQIAVTLIPARQTSGDFFDALRLPGGELAIVMADVVDKGVGAALFMAMSSALLRTYLTEHPGQPHQVLAAVNQRILEYTAAGQFATVFLGILDPLTGQLTFANAGHDPPLWLRRSGGLAPEPLRNTGIPLGVTEDATWENRSISLAAGDCLFLYTDGVTEAEDLTGQFFGEERLVEELCRYQGAAAETIREAVVAAVRRFAGDRPLSDDIALMVLARNGSADMAP